MLNDHLPDDVKEKRLARVLDLQANMTSRSNEKLVNSVQEVLVDGLSKKGGTVSGRTRGNKAVNIDAPVACIGSLVRVRIIAAGMNSLTGQLCE
jgi:tRNA-2-methylthio-N6-dimethylallyladenosine synthase